MNPVQRRAWSGAALAALSAGALLVAACSEDDLNPVGAGELPPPSDSIQEIVLFPTDARTFLTGTSDRAFGSILVAAHDLPDPTGFESRILLRFALAIGDTTQGPVTVDSAQVRLVFSGVDPDSVSFRLHRVTETWVEEEVSWDERTFEVPWSQPGGTFDPVPLVTGTIAGDSLAFALPDTLVQHWLDVSEENEGLILLLDTPASFARVVAASTTTLPSELGPRLRVFTTVDTTSSSSNVLATADAFIDRFAGAMLPGLIVGQEPFFRSLLFFDLSALPPDANINLAELQLTPRQVVSPVDSLPIELRRAVSAFLGGSTVFTTGTSVGLSGFLDAAAARIDSTAVFSGSSLASVLRLWQLDPTLNLGLGLVVQRRSGNLGFAVYAGLDAAPEDRPRLRIIFTPALEPDLGRSRP